MRARVWPENRPDGLIAKDPREGQVINVNTHRKYIAQGKQKGPEFRGSLPKKEYMIFAKKNEVCLYKNDTVLHGLQATSKSSIWQVEVIDRMFVRDFH